MRKWRRLTPWIGTKSMIGTNEIYTHKDNKEQGGVSALLFI